MLSDVVMEGMGGAELIAEPFTPFTSSRLPFTPSRRTGAELIVEIRARYGDAIEP